MVKNSAVLSEAAEKDLLIKQLELRSIQQEQEILKYQAELESKKQENAQLSKTVEERDQQMVSLKAIIKKRRERSKQDIEQVTSFLKSQILSSPTLKNIVEPKKLDSIAQSAKENCSPNMEVPSPAPVVQTPTKEQKVVKEKKREQEIVQAVLPTRIPKLNSLDLRKDSTPAKEGKRYHCITECRKEKTSKFAVIFWT